MSTAATPRTEPVDSARNSRLVAAGILLSRLFGLVRDRAFANYFGTSAAAGAFRVAFKIPNLLQNLLGEGVLSASFIPVYSRLLAEGEDEEAGRVAGAIGSLLALVTSALVLLVILLAPVLVKVLTLGRFDPGVEALTIDLLRIVAPGTGILVLSAWCLGVLNSHRRFFLSYVAPVLWNIAQIAVLVVAGGLVLAPLGGADSEARTRLVMLLAYGTVAGSLLQFWVQLPGVLKVEPNLQLALGLRLEGVRTALRAFLPVVAGRGVVQIGALVDISLAGLLTSPASAVAALAYAQTLFILPVSLFGMSVAAAELPELSRAGTTDLTPVRDRLVAGSRRIAFFVAPTTVAFVVLGDFVVGLLYRSGAFGRAEELQVWSALVAFAIGLLATTATRLLQSVYYGLGDTRTPAKMAALRLVVGLVAALAVMFVADAFVVTDDGFARATSLGDGDDLKRLGVVGIALGSAAASWAEFVVLRRRLTAVLGAHLPLGGGLLGQLWRPLGAMAAVGVLAHVLLGGLPRLVGSPIALGLAGLTYLVVAARGGVAESRAIFSSVADRMDRRSAG